MIIQPTNMLKWCWHANWNPTFNIGFRLPFQHDFNIAVGWNNIIYSTLSQHWIGVDNPTLKWCLHANWNPTFNIGFRLPFQHDFNSGLHKNNVEILLVWQPKSNNERRIQVGKSTIFRRWFINSNSMLN